MQQKHDEIKTLAEDILRHGDLFLVSEKSHGKTEALKTLASTFRSMENTRVIVFEDFPKWVNEFESVPYMLIRDRDVLETQHVVDLADIFLRHDKSFSVVRGSEIKQALEDHKDIIFLMQIEDIDRQAFFIYSVVKHFYRKQYLRAYKGYKKFERVVFLVEESQNVFDSSTISKKMFNRLRKIFSVARNLGLHFVLASQRMQDLNTRIRSRTRLMLGRVSTDDYELKIRRLLRHSKFKKEILDFNQGEWLSVASDTKIKFPLLPEPQYKPYEVNRVVRPQPRPQEPKKKDGLLVRIAKRLTGYQEPQFDISYGEDTFDQEDNEFLEEVNDLDIS